MNDEPTNSSTVLLVPLNVMWSSVITELVARIDSPSESGYSIST